MNNIERVIEAIKSECDYMDAIALTTGLSKDDVRHAFDHLVCTGQIEGYANAPRPTNRGRPQRRYRMTDRYSAIAEAAQALEEAKEAMRRAQDMMRNAKRATEPKKRYDTEAMRSLRQQVGVFAGLLA